LIGQTCNNLFVDTPQ